MHLDSVKYYLKIPMNTDGSFTQSSNKTLELLMAKHFPDCKDESDENPGPQDLTLSTNVDKKECILASFLDIGGAFNNVKISSILAKCSKCSKRKSVKD